MSRRGSGLAEVVRRLLSQQGVDEVGVDWGTDPDEDRKQPRVRVDSLAFEETQKSWIEHVFVKRECRHFIPSGKDKGRCCCGRLTDKHFVKAVLEHQLSGGGEGGGEVKWSPQLHTEVTSTDAYGTIEFQGGPHPTKAQFVRLSYDSQPDQVLQLLQKQWNLELPKLLISVHGGIANFELQPKLRRVFRKGLLKAAKTTGAWIVSAGINTGVVKHVGNALGDTLSQARNNIVTLGVAPWGVVQNRSDLIGRDVTTPYHAIAAPKTNNVVLNSNHSYFLLVDNGTVGKYGCEIILRKKLEKHIQQQKIITRSGAKNYSIPVVSLILEGGTNTIRTVLECITDTPPVPVVVCDGSGRAADLLAFTHKYAQDDGTMPETLRDQLIQTIEKTFQYNREQAEKLFIELMLCVKKKELITVFRMGEESQDIDLAILTALLKAQDASAQDQLSLALTWNRVDIARSHIFVYGQEWPDGTLDQAMMDALVNDRVDFVKLFLENGVSMQKWLSITRLEELYNIRQETGSTLSYLLKEHKKKKPSRTHQISLYDIGVVIEKLMGGAYRASFCRKQFKVMYNAVMRKHLDPESYQRRTENTGGHTISNFITEVPVPIDLQHLNEAFQYPYHELMVWAVLLQRQDMARFMWQHGEEALAKALIACKLYKSMAHEAAQDDLESDISEALKQYAREFSQLALDLLEQCYKTDDDLTQHLLTYELEHWSDQTCLSLAVSANHKELIAHTCCQILLTEMWMGALRMRKYTNLKVVLGIVFFPVLLCLEFKSKEELQLMPQTIEEHMQGIADADSDVSSTHPEDQALQTDADRPSMLSNQHGHDLLSDLSVTIKSKKSSLRLGRKISEFYTAPVTKFWVHTLGYISFLMFFTYIVLIHMPVMPSWQEWFVIAYLFTLCVEKLREFAESEPNKFSQKLFVFYCDVWNITDSVAILLFFVGVVLRLLPHTRGLAKVFYCVTVIPWYIRLMEIFGVSKNLGPYVTMIGKMMKDLVNFVVILLIVLMAFGVVRQSVTFPNEKPSLSLAKHVFLKPYFMLYGEVYAAEIDPECSDTDPYNEYKCVPGRWVVPTAMTMYLIVANILLINLLIAVFNNTFQQINAISMQVWKFQRYNLVIEYEGKPILPPPFIILCHIYLLIRFIIRRCRGKSMHFDNGLKLFLDKEEVEKLHDFEEECMQDLFRISEEQRTHSTEAKIHNTYDRTENMSMRLDDMIQKENNIRLTMQSVDFRLAKLEELVLQNIETVSRLTSFTPIQIPHIPAQEKCEKFEEVQGFRPTDLPVSKLYQRAPAKVAKSLIQKKRDRLRPFTDYRKRSYTSRKLSRSVSAPDYDQPISLQAELENIYTSFASSTFSPLSSFDSEGTSTDAVFFNHTPPAEYQPPPRQPLARKSSAPAAVSCDLFSKKKRRLFARGRSNNQASRKEYSPVDENPEHTFCPSPQNERSSATVQEPPAGKSAFAAAQKNPSLKPRLKLASRQLSVDYGDGIDDEFARPQDVLGLASTGVSLDSVGTTPYLPPLLTPIVTANRADYTSITDDIDTSCAAYHSPRGSPTTPNSFNLGEEEMNLDTYTKKEQKKPQIRMANNNNHRRKVSPHRVAVRSEAEQLKHAEESEHELMEMMIRRRMRQISLTESDSMSEIASQVIMDMEGRLGRIEGDGYHSDQEGNHNNHEGEGSYQSNHKEGGGYHSNHEGGAGGGGGLSGHREEGGIQNGGVIMGIKATNSDPCLRKDSSD